MLRFPKCCNEHPHHKTAWHATRQESSPHLLSHNSQNQYGCMYNFEITFGAIVWQPTSLVDAATNLSSPSPRSSFLYTGSSFSRVYTCIQYSPYLCCERQLSRGFFPTRLTGRARGSVPLRRDESRDDLIYYCYSRHRRKKYGRTRESTPKSGQKTISPREPLVATRTAKATESPGDFKLVR